MMPSDAAVLLAKCAAFDQRTVGRGDAASWAEVLTDADVDLDAALAVVSEHYRTERSRIMAADIIDAVAEVRRERLAAAIKAAPHGVIPMPAELDQAAERDWRKAWIAAAKAGHPNPSAVADDALRIRPVELAPVPMPAEVRAAITGFVRSHSVPAVRS